MHALFYSPFFLVWIIIIILIYDRLLYWIIFILIDIVLNNNDNNNNNCMQGSFVYMSIMGTVASNETHPLGPLWKEYGKADSRWLYSNSCVVSVEA